MCGDCAAAEDNTDLHDRSALQFAHDDEENAQRSGGGGQDKEGGGQSLLAVGPTDLHNTVRHVEGRCEA